MNLRREDGCKRIFLLGDTTTPQSLNRYAYCINEPVDRVDPYGSYTIPLWWKFIAAIADPIIRQKLGELPPPLPSFRYPVTIKPPFVNISPPYPIPSPSLSFSIATNLFKVFIEWGAETFWGPPGRPRLNEGIAISPLEALIAKRSGLTAEDLGF